MKRCRVEKVWTEMARLQSAISALHSAYTNQPDWYCNSPRETGAVRRASMDLTRALADMRKSGYIKLPGGEMKKPLLQALEESAARITALEITIRTFLHDLDAHEAMVQPSEIRMNHAMWMQVQAFRNLLGEK